MMRRGLLVIAAVLLSGCVGMPDGVTPVDGFELDRYLGKWHEIARLDHSFERGLSRVTAQYSVREDGGVRVINRGFNAKKGKWQESEGKAYFVEEATLGFLKVSFFGPFYGSYVIFELDKDDYQYSFVSGPNTSYLWLLSRSPEVSPEVMEQFLTMAKSRGFATEDLIMVEHE
ncbi:MAG TPA: lipocalin family protein [Xanthomonadales bacterium]|nr:lipocalin family protein [Xanthomonadales bacterium]